jgi:hypothetical protein
MEYLDFEPYELEDQLDKCQVIDKSLMLMLPTHKQIGEKLKKLKKIYTKILPLGSVYNYRVTQVVLTLWICKGALRR